jgi:hypothetical protein
MSELLVQAPPVLASVLNKESCAPLAQLNQSGQANPATAVSWERPLHISQRDFSISWEG